MNRIIVKYRTQNVPRLQEIPQGDWLDLSLATDKSITLKQGDSTLLDLGVVMQLPKGFEAHLLPRSSTFKKTGLLLANSMGIIDSSYCGPNDYWGAMVYATKDIALEAHQRLFQFRIVPTMAQNSPQLTIVEDEDHFKAHHDRGGFGSTD